MNKAILIYVVTAILCGSNVSCERFQSSRKEEVYKLVDDLKSNEKRIRESAKEELPKYKDIAVKPLFDFIIQISDESYRREGVYCLSKIKTEDSASALISFFRRTHDIPNEVKKALVNIGNPAITPLFDAYTDVDENVRLMSLDVLNEMINQMLHEDKIISDVKNLFLKAFREDRSTIVRIGSLHFLAQFKDSEEVKNVIENALQDRNDEIRDIATEILSSSQPKFTENKRERIMDVYHGLKEYYDLKQHYPATLDELIFETRVEKEWLLNPWGFPYIYEVAKDKRSFRLISLGKDGKENTGDEVIITGG